MRKIIIDTDTASDDAVALVCALRDPQLQVLAITTVAGNVPLELASYNARMSVEYADTYAPPIYAGCAGPLFCPLETADQVHGKDGMGDLDQTPGCTPLRAPTIPLTPGHAVDALIAHIEAEKEPIDLITLGPLTNVATAMRKAPEVMKKLRHITIMGGAHHYHNPHTVCAEFNIMVDPEAADIVCTFGVPITMVTLEACAGRARLGPDMIEKLRACGEIGDFFVDCNRTMIENARAAEGAPSFDLPDPVTVAVFSHPEMATTRFESHLRVETKGDYTRGMTLFIKPDDFYSLTLPEPLPLTAEIVTEVDPQQFWQYLLACARK